MPGVFARACRPPPRTGGAWNFDQLEPSVAVRGLHHRALRPDALEPHHAVHPTALDLPFALQLESELDEERRRGREVVDHDAQALDRHALDGRDTTAQRGHVGRAGSHGSRTCGLSTTRPVRESAVDVSSGAVG
jgi:hypothetical protein